ncbi:uncharacterized protein LOC135226203 [Macrobrachium nipponense]|uniref:uncharacterized protein LOC135226203 n=1 Tax=Macrobrachium nipponense TaxID=159736 RepID=UPI0030C832AF
MAPESQCLSREGLVDTHRSFVTRVMALPAVDQAAAMYRVTKEQQPYVGVALRLAEAGIMRTVTATGAIIPLATPIANHVDGLACQVLDNVVKVAPIITKPTDEIVDETRHFVMRSIAGGQHHSKPLTLKSALVARASDVVDRASATDYGRALIQIAESVLHSAHHAVDTYLPPAEGDIHHADGYEGNISSKAFSLVYKTHGRLRRTAMRMLKSNNNGNEDEEIVIYPLHLVENGDHRYVKWYYSLHDIPYVQQVTSATTAAHTVVVKNIGFFLGTAVKFPRIISTAVIKTAGKSYSVITVNGMDAVRYCSSNSVQLGKCVTMAAVGTVNNATWMVSSAAHNAFSTGVATTSAITNTSKDLVKTVVNTGVCMTHRAMAHCMALTKALPDFGVSKRSQNLFQTIQATFHTLKAQGTTTVFTAKQRCTDALGKALLGVPPSLYIRGHLLYMQLLIACGALRQYPAQVLRTSSQMLESARHIPIDSYAWLSNKDLFIQGYLLTVNIQSRLSSLLKNFSLDASKVKLS